MDFATVSDVEKRIGRSLSEGEKGIAESAIATVTGLILDCVDRDQTWADGLNPVPGALTGVCVEKALGAIANPLNLAAQSETLGAYSSSQTFPRTGDVSVFLTPFEERLISRAVYGTTSGSSVPKGMFDRQIELAMSSAGEVDEAE